MKRTLYVAALGALLALPACGGNSGDDSLDGIDSIVFLQLVPGNDGMGDIFQHNSYRPGGRLVSLTPPTADGTLDVLCCDHLGPEFEGADFRGYDVSYDASEIVFSARFQGDSNYGLYVIDLTTREVEQLPTNPNAAYIYPKFMPGDRIAFNTTDNVEEGAPQFRDEYERGTTLQMGTMFRTGGEPVLAARNLSHMVFGDVMPNGEILFTQWDHLANMNAGHLLRAGQNFANRVEFFGKEGRGVTNSYYKAVAVAPGRVVAIGSTRDRTVQAGTILDIRGGETYMVGDELHADRNMSEANSSVRILTPNVPLGMEDSSNSIGRYYSAYPLNAKEYPDLLVSWSDGVVQSETLAAAGLTAQFGVYLYDSKDQRRKPLYDDQAYWEVFPKPLAARTAPPVIEGVFEQGNDPVLIGSMDVYQSSLDTFAPGSIYGVRVIEGFSVEEGIPEDFGLTEAEGAAVLGIALVRGDGSWAAEIPANVPVHQQVVDVYGMSLRNEPIWITGNSGESRFCGGCHEDRAATTVINPGITEALAFGPADLLSGVERFSRISPESAMLATAGSTENLVGVPWNRAGEEIQTLGNELGIQAIFDAKCVSCHDGTPGIANPQYTIVDPENPEMAQTITFNLSGAPSPYDFGEMMSGYTMSHLSLLGPDMMDLEDAGLEVMGDMKIYVEPESARTSELMKILDPYPLFAIGVEGLSPNAAGTRAFNTTQGTVDHTNLGAHGSTNLTAEEYYMLILMIDNGAQFYARENAPGADY